VVKEEGVSDELELLLAERAIHRVLTTYSRGVDRLDFESVRSCYWPDGTDDHGSFVGGVDGGGGFADGHVRGMRSPDDIVHRILDRSRG
jgi:hypothetical protein